MKTELTKKQYSFLLFLTRHIQEKGYPPTIREIVHHFKLASTNSVKKYLDILERKGYIRRIPNSPRTIEVCIQTPESPVPAMNRHGTWPERYRTSHARMIPIAGRVRAGEPHLAVEDITGHFAIDKSMARWDNTFLLRVEGDSMIDAHIQDGDFVLVKPQLTAESGEIVVAIINDEATVKRFSRKRNNIYLEPANPTMKPIVIKENQAHETTIVGKVVAVLRQIK